MSLTFYFMFILHLIILTLHLLILDFNLTVFTFYHMVFENEDDSKTLWKKFLEENLVKKSEFLKKW